MPLSVSEAALLNNKIAAAIDKIGKNGSAMPKSNSNQDTYAYQLLLGQHIKRAGEAMVQEAMVLCVANKLIPDHKQSPLDAGTREDVYSGDVVRIECQVKRGSAKTDWMAVGNALIKAGLVTAETWRMCVAKHTTLNASPHQFTALLKT